MQVTNLQPSSKVKFDGNSPIQSATSTPTGSSCYTHLCRTHVSICESIFFNDFDIVVCMHLVFGIQFWNKLFNTNNYSSCQFEHVRQTVGTCGFEARFNNIVFEIFSMIFMNPNLYELQFIAEYASYQQSMICIF